MKTVFKKGQTVYWGELKGEVVDILNGSLPLTVKFKGCRYYFTLDGRIFTETPIILSLTPYTLNGFSQQPIIEKDTLVYVKDSEKYDWVMKYYSHFENGRHYCFVNQLKSCQTEESRSWSYVETENPLLK